MSIENCCIDLMCDYPSDEVLEAIRNYKFDRINEADEFFNFIRNNWWIPEFGFTRSVTKKGFVRYRLATGGWSGNESIIYAMKDNWLFWAFWWKSSSRGGLHIFQEQPFGRRNLQKND